MALGQQCHYFATDSLIRLPSIAIVMVMVVFCQRVNDTMTDVGWTPSVYIQGIDVLQFLEFVFLVCVLVEKEKMTVDHAFTRSFSHIVVNMTVGVVMNEHHAGRPTPTSLTAS
jgi:hypothetical protein